MKALMVNVVVGAVLFAAALAGTLAATGRLDRDGVASIPLLGRLLPPQEPPAGGADVGQAQAAAAAASGDDEIATVAPLKRGRSVLEDGAGSGGGKDRTEPAGQQPRAAGDRTVSTMAPHPAERDFDHGAADAARQRQDPYASGGLFRFEGMPAGLSAKQIDEAWQRVQAATRELEHRRQAQELRERELQMLADDIARRQTEVGKERSEVESLQRQLDERMEAFRQQVKMVRSDEAAGLKRYAQTLASFDAAKAAAIVQDLWRTESGQDEIVKTMEFMARDAANAILAELPKELVRELLQRRMRVVREPDPARPPR